jgi:hypothetical protein
MLFRNIDIENIPELKNLCNKIIDEYSKTKIENNITLKEFIYDYINNMCVIEKNIIINSFNILQLDNYNSNILKKINNKYDGEPLIAICYDLIYK